MFMHLLIYGFGPYLGFHDNVTEKIVRKLRKRRWFQKVIFPVRFYRSQFINVIKAYDPDVILGLGQCSRGRLLRIESTAINQRRNSKSEKARRIAADSSRRLSSNLKLSLGRHARSSKDAGEYVCNYSMYVILDFLKRRRLPVRYGFIHVPRGYDPRKATRILKRAMGDIGQEG